MVEAQHVASTMKLVDDEREQDLLETLLESSKPKGPADTDGLDYLLATPFRYPTRRHGSRFRGPTDPGVYYGAESVSAAGAELGYWRWRFLADAVDLERLDPVPHTAFSVAVEDQAIDLRQAPFDRDSAAWTHPSDYSATQALGRSARDAGLGVILYRSVRHPTPAWCVAVLRSGAFAARKPNPRRQTWYLAVTPGQVTWRSAGRSMRFDASPWQR